MKKSKVLVTGGSGLIGSKFPNETSNHTFIKIGSQQFDLTKESECQKMFDNVSPDAVIHLAAKVGGIKSVCKRTSKKLIILGKTVARP